MINDRKTESCLTAEDSLREIYKGCRLCPRYCGADRTQNYGRCGSGALPRVAAASLHKWEEPCISGKTGAGTVFFSGCSLGCVFCQNREISINGKGEEISIDRLAEIINKLESVGAETIDLVTPTHFTPSVLQSLALASPSVPVVWNSGGYELAENIPSIAERADVYLPDIKYCSSELAFEMCNAPDYFEKALSALVCAVERFGECSFDQRGIIRRGVIVRHLVLPGNRADSIKVLETIAKEIDVSLIRLSLMSQFTPMHPEYLPERMRRTVTSFEYGSVLNRADELGFRGWSQGRASAKERYLPNFDLTVLGEKIVKG